MPTLKQRKHCTNIITKVTAGGLNALEKSTHNTNRGATVRLHMDHLHKHTEPLPRN